MSFLPTLVILLSGTVHMRLPRQKSICARARPGFGRALCSGIYFPLIFAMRFLLILLNARRLQSGKRLILLNDIGRSLLRIVAASDAVLAVGGGYLNSKWRYDQLYAKCLVCVLAKSLGKSVIFSGQGIGPIESWLDRSLTRWALSKADAIVVRDHGASSLLLRQIGVSGPIVEEGTDDAIGLTGATDQDVGEYLARSGVDTNQPSIALSLHRWEGLEGLQAELPGLFDELVEFRGYANPDATDVLSISG